MDLSLAEAAAHLGKSPRQVRYLIKQGKLRARKRGSAWVIDSTDLPRSEAQVEAALAKQTQATTSTLLETVEHELMAALVGLLRRTERRSHA